MNFFVLTKTRIIRHTQVPTLFLPIYLVQELVYGGAFRTFKFCLKKQNLVTIYQAKIFSF